MRGLPVNLEAKIPGCKHFTWAEALWLPSVTAYASPNEFQQNNIIRQALALDRVRDYFNKPIIVTSWLRPAKYNEMIGGASRSKHLLGLATDFIVRGVDTSVAKNIIRNNPDVYPGRGEIDTTTWIHLDLTDADWFYARRPTA